MQGSRKRTARKFTVRPRSLGDAKPGSGKSFQTGQALGANSLDPIALRREPPAGPITRPGDRHQMARRAAAEGQDELALETPEGFSGPPATRRRDHGGAGHSAASALSSQQFSCPALPRSIPRLIEIGVGKA
jgi:hypothetical protein